LADIVAKRFCPSERARLIQGQARMRNVDSKIFRRRFDCCEFLFHRIVAATFATISAHLCRRDWPSVTAAIGGEADIDSLRLDVWT
jgi:hypothetical protein